MTEINGKELAILMERTKSIKADMGEVNERTKLIESELNQFRREYVQAHADVVYVCEANAKRLDKLEPRVKDMEDTISPLVMWGKVLAFIGTILGGSVIAQADRLMPNRVIGLIGIYTFKNIEYPIA